MNYQAKYWKIQKSETSVTCENEECKIILPGKIYFDIETEKAKYKKVCLDCFIDFCANEVAKLMSEMLEYKNIIGKCQMAKEENGNKNNEYKGK